MLGVSAHYKGDLIPLPVEKLVKANTMGKRNARWDSSEVREAQVFCTL